MKDDQLFNLLSSLSQDITEIKKSITKPEQKKGDSNADVSAVLNDIKSSLDQLGSKQNANLDPGKFENSIKLLGDEIIKLREPIDAIHHSVFPEAKELIVSYLWPWQRFVFSLFLAILFFSFGLFSSAVIAQYIHNR